MARANPRTVVVINLGGGISMAWFSHVKSVVQAGYRHLDTQKIAPLFLFGFGLSYTHFKFSNLKIA